MSKMLFKINVQYLGQPEGSLNFGKPLLRYFLLVIMASTVPKVLQRRLAKSEIWLRQRRKCPQIANIIMLTPLYAILKTYVNALV